MFGQSHWLALCFSDILRLKAFVLCLVLSWPVRKASMMRLLRYVKKYRLFNGGNTNPVYGNNQQPKFICCFKHLSPYWLCFFIAGESSVSSTGYFWGKSLTFSTTKAHFTIEFMHIITRNILLNLIYFCRLISQVPTAVKIICTPRFPKTVVKLVVEVVDKVEELQ